MPQYQVRLLEPPGRDRRCVVHAASPQAVAAALGVTPGQVLEVHALDEAGTAARARWSAPWASRTRLDARLFAQEVAVLLEAGVPLVEALQTLRETQGAAASPIDGVIAALREGQPLSAALARADGGSGVFDELFVALVAASERSGQLAPMLRHHAAYLAWNERLRAHLVAASVYPLMLLGAGTAVVLFLLLFVLPRFAGVFEGLATELPLGSRWLMSLGVAAAAQPALATALATALLAAPWLAWRTPSLRQRVQAVAWQLPGLGARLRTVALARLYRCVGLLAQAGVPLPEALRLAEQVLDAPLRPALRRAGAEVSAGQRLSHAWQQQGLATPVALRMLRVGEGSGGVAQMLGQAAAFHDEEVQRLSELVTRVVNPLLMLVMGVVIGSIVVLMYLPIFTLMEQVQ
jgi:general secretion pathway protein F